jgi:hypothetical protein
VHVDAARGCSMLHHGQVVPMQRNDCTKQPCERGESGDPMNFFSYLLEFPRRSAVITSRWLTPPVITQKRVPLRHMSG